MAAKIYGVFSLTGGGATALDTIDGAILEDGDSALVFTESDTYTYNLDTTSGAPESSPDVIMPDNNADNKRWILVSSKLKMFTDIGGDILPDVDNIRSIGSPSLQWKDVYVGPGSFYVNGQKVIEDNSGTIVLSADDDQNIQIKSGGGGDIEFYPSGSGNIDMKGTVSIQAGKNLMSGDGNPISNTVGFTMNGELIRDLATPILGTDAVTKDFSTNADNLVTGTIDAGLLPGDYLEKSDNLASLGNITIAKTNLGLENVTNLDFTDASNITSGTLPSSVLPPVAIVSVQTAADEVTMLGLTTQEGDTVVRLDQDITYMHNGGSTGTMADFTQLAAATAAPVNSVNGDTGTVVLTQDDIGNGSTYVQTQNDLTDAKSALLDGVTSAATGDTIALRTSNGDITFRYVNCSYVNATGAQSTRNVDTVFYSSNDNYMRKNTAAGFKTSLGLENAPNIAAATGNTANTLVLRGASGQFSAGVITATCTTARYSDLAEKYTCENVHLEEGTVVSSTTEGEYDAQMCLVEKADNVIGVISAQPSYLMDSELTNSIVVGVVGKVPVKVVGPVEKGKPIVSAGGGCARQANGELELLYKIGLSLEENLDPGEKLVYCSIK